MSQHVSARQTLGRLIRYFTPYRWQMAIVAAAALGYVLLSIQIPRLFGQATTLIVSGLSDVQHPHLDFASLAQLAGILALCYFGAAASNYLSKFIVVKVTAQVSYTLSRSIKEKLTRMPIRYYDQHAKGDLMSRTVNDVATLSESMMQVLMQVMLSSLVLIGIVVMMFSINWQLSLIAVCGLPLSLFAIQLVVRRSQSLFRSQQQQLGQLNSFIEEYYSGHEIVKAFNQEATATEQFQEVNAALFHSGWRAQFYASLMFPISRLINNLVYVVLCVVGGFLATQGVLAIGDIQAILQYTNQLSHPLGELAEMINMVQSGLAAAERIFELLDFEEMPQDHPTTLPNVSGAVRFEHVQFGYEANRMLMHDLNIDIQAGETVAIVGPTGAGKTTVINLLMRFYDTNSGAILIDGHNITDYSKASLRSTIGMVLQDTWLFQGTIMDNIRYANPTASDDEVVEAAKQAFADDFIRKLPDGYHSVINEQSDNISQGQKQLLTIARAILARPEVFILDEATSNIDTRTELQIQAAMDRIMANKTSFVIAHRLSTIRNANKILVMQHGDVVEFGTHQQLLQQNGVYAGLYNAQFEQ